MKRALKQSDGEMSLVEFESHINPFAPILQWWSAQLGAQHCCLHLYNAQRNLLEDGCALGLPEAVVRLSREHPTVRGQIDLSVATQRLIQVPDLRQDPFYESCLREFEAIGLRSVWTMPLIWNDQLVGVVHTYSGQVRTLTSEEYALAYSCAQTVAQAVSRSLKTNVRSMLTALQEFRRGAPREHLSSFVREDVLTSWERCRERFGSHAQPPGHPSLTPAQLYEVQESDANLLRAANQHLNSLFQRLEELDCAVLLADAEGWVIHILGNARHQHQLKKEGIGLGVNISECYLGNSALGTALATRKSIYFHSCEHYFHNHQHWSSAGAPILIEKGSRLLGAISFVTVSQRLNPYIFPLVQSTSIAISNWFQLDELQQDESRVHQSILSQLDYHVVQLDVSNRVITQRHPIPVVDEVQAAMICITQKGEYNHYEVPIMGGTYVVDVRNLWDAKGVLKGRLGLFRDVTQNKQIEFRLRDTERLSALTSLAAGIAHEIRNPLTTARGFLQLFAERLKTDEEKRFLGLTIAELDRIQQLVKDFMSLAKPDGPHYQETNLTEVIKRTVHFLRPEATLHGVTLVMDTPLNPVHIWADENQMKQVLLNIVQNALHACESHDCVKVQLASHPHQVEITVEDNGCGMNPEQLQRIFQPFYTTKTSGTGLGLSISKHMVEEHEGSISIESTPGVGTTVHIYFPALSGQVGTYTVPSPSMPSAQ